MAVDNADFCARPPQQAPDVDPMLFYCWSSIVDGGPTIKQHWSASRIC